MPGCIPLIRDSTHLDFASFVITTANYTSDATLALHDCWESLLEYNKPLETALLLHVSKYLMCELELLNWEDNLLHQWTHFTLCLADHLHRILSFVIKQ